MFKIVLICLIEIIPVLNFVWKKKIEKNKHPRLSTITLYMISTDHSQPQLDVNICFQSFC
jgi:hypothetical protein